MKGLIEAIDAESLKAEVPAFNVGDTVKIGNFVPLGRDDIYEIYHMAL